MSLITRSECSRRKVKCDKQIPCTRCTRLGKSCSREVVRTSKSLAASRGEMQFLQSLQDQLSGIAGSELAIQELQGRIATLEYRRQSPPASETPSSPAQTPASPRVYRNERQISQDASGSPMQTDEMMGGLDDRSAEAESRSQTPQPTGAATVKCLESLAWGRNSGSCYPHRRCNCPRYRSYCELASITCDLANPMLQWAPVNIDPSILLSSEDDRKLMRFHVEQLWWHHNTLHSTTFLEQCEVFWTLGTAVHPLWLALYLSITCVSR